MTTMPLDGIRIIDVSWMLAVPFSTRILAQFGAEVIKVESLRKVDGLRVYGPWPEGKQTPPNGSGWFATGNLNKKSLQLDLTTAKGGEIFKQLVKISDIVVENMRERAMKQFGLEYPILREVNPGIIMASCSGYGRTAIFHDLPAYGPIVEAMSGISYLTGLPDRPPCTVGTPWADYLVASHLGVALLAAIEHRRRTGEGQYIDISMLEMCVSTIGTQILDYLANGRNQQRMGNRHPWAASHSCYRCKGEDRWCVIAVYSDQEWHVFSKAVNRPWTQDSRFASVVDRLRNVDELDRLVETWTVNFTPEEMMHMLQKEGVAAAVVQNVEDMMLRDSHLKARGFFQDIDDPIAGKRRYESQGFKLMDVPKSLHNPAPLLGQHTDQILKELLHMDTVEIERLRAEKVLN